MQREGDTVSLDDCGTRAAASGHGDVNGDDASARRFLPSPTRVPRCDALLASGRPVVEVAAGREHTLFRTRDGAVLACGRNGDAQLGLRATMGPRLVSMLEPSELRLRFV